MGCNTCGGTPITNTATAGSSDISFISTKSSISRIDVKSANALAGQYVKTALDRNKVYYSTNSAFGRGFGFTGDFSKLPLGDPPKPIYDLYTFKWSVVTDAYAIFEGVPNEDLYKKVVGIVYLFKHANQISNPRVPPTILTFIQYGKWDAMYDFNLSAGVQTRTIGSSSGWSRAY